MRSQAPIFHFPLPLFHLLFSLNCQGVVFSPPSLPPYLEGVPMRLGLPQMLQALIKLFRRVRKDHFVVILVDYRLSGKKREGGGKGGRKG